MLSFSNDQKTAKVGKLYDNLIEEQNNLSSDGLQIATEEKPNPFKVYFQLVSVLGDNLGTNEILGFSETFNSGQPCRVCTATIEQMKKMTREDVSLLRTRESYEPNSDGVKSSCIFNKVKGFHVCENYSLDLMHDLFEGVANYLMVNVLQYLIYEKGFFTIEFLNRQI